MKTARQENWKGMNWVRQSTRLAIYLRDGLSCVYCGASVEEGTQLTLDHVVPASQGGSDKPTNLVTCCHKCNCSRGNRTMPAFARSVAGYINHGVTAQEIIAHVRATARRTLPRQEARELISRRGSAAKALAAAGRK